MYVRSLREDCELSHSLTERTYAKNGDSDMQTCQMTMESDFISRTSAKCGRAAKFRVPSPQMGVEYVCGIHARSLNRMFERTEQDKRCIPIAQKSHIE
jgi:hypothetical protein